jgi:hypothetical protein
VVCGQESDGRYCFVLNKTDHLKGNLNDINSARIHCLNRPATRYSSVPESQQKRIGISQIIPNDAIYIAAFIITVPGMA